MKEALIKILKDWVITGILITLPLVCTFYIIIWIFQIFDAIIIAPLDDGNILKKIPGAGIVIFILLMAVIGAIGKNFIGKYFVKLSDKFITKIPLVKTIYSLIKQVFDTILAPGASSFQEVVLVEYPRLGMWTPAFITSEAKGEIQEKTTDEVVSVFIPTTPNPTSGFLIFVPKKDLIFLKMKPEIAMKLIISGGIVSGEENLAQLGVTKNHSNDKTNKEEDIRKLQ